MEFRLPRKDWKSKVNETLLPQYCMVCMMPASKGKIGEIVYNAPAGALKELKNFRLPIPLCNNHFEKYTRGAFLAKLSMYFLIGGFIPFLISLILMQFYGQTAVLIALFVIALGLSIFGYVLIGPANKLLGENGRKAFSIALITGSEIIINVQDKNLAEFLKKHLNK
jgi:hypothetical protein